MDHSPAIPFAEAVRVWVRVGLQSFGGPAGQIAVMHRILVEEKRWVSEQRFLHALNYCMLLPGPEAQQLATYIGWLLHGYRGGLVAGLLFVLPGFVTILALSFAYAALQGVGEVAALLFGLKAAVVAIVLDAVVRIGRRVVRNRAMLSIAALAFIGIFFFAIPFPLIVGTAAVIGFVGGRVRPGSFSLPDAHEKPGDASTVSHSPQDDTRPSFGRAVRVLTVWGALWALPVVLLIAFLGSAHVLSREAVFFSKAATVTFGGAYAVLAYIAQQAVERFGWLEPGEMLDGLGMAETTPGPLIMVVQFVGFMGAFRNPGTIDPYLAGTFGAIVTTWVTFVPCFLWIFLGAPYVEWLRGNRNLTSALTAVTAAVAGVILNLGVWFAIHLFFTEVADARIAPGLRMLVPDWSTIDPFAIALSVVASVAIIRYRVSVPAVLVGCMLAGLLIR